MLDHQPKEQCDWRQLLNVLKVGFSERAFVQARKIFERKAGDVPREARAATEHDVTVGRIAAGV